MIGTLRYALQYYNLWYTNVLHLCGTDLPIGRTTKSEFSIHRVKDYTGLTVNTATSVGEFVDITVIFLSLHQRVIRKLMQIVIW